MKLSDLGPNSAVIRYNKCFGSKIPNNEEINKFIDDDVELFRNQLATLNAGEIKYLRQLWSEVSKRSQKVNFAGKHLITFLDFTSSNSRTPFTFNALAIKAFIRYFSAIEAILITISYNSTQEELKTKLKVKRASKIKGITVAAFYKYLSSSNNFKRKEDERVVDYCNRINEIFNLPINTKIETDFGKNDDKRIKTIKSDILPTIKNPELKKELEEYFEEIDLKSRR
jgi:predicted transcriptional regulator